MAHAESDKTRARLIDAGMEPSRDRACGETAANGKPAPPLAPVPDPIPSIRAEPDARLVERARLGDEDAFAELVTRHERKLIRVLTRIVHDQESARDLAQETFWKVYNRLDRFDLTRRFGPWLFRIGLNLAFDWLRKHPPAPTISLDGSSSQRFGSSSHRDSDAEFAQRYEPFNPDPRVREDLVQEVRFILEQIPLSYRAILILRDLEGFSSAEAAAIINRREGTIRWRLSKAREMFRLLWEKRQRWDHGAVSAPNPFPDDLEPDSVPNAEANSGACLELNWLADPDDPKTAAPEPRSESEVKLDSGRKRRSRSRSQSPR